MISDATIVNIIRFIGLVSFQVLILKNIDVHPFVNLYIYPLFFVMLPFKTPPWAALLLAFTAGMLVGVFYNQAGIHAASSVFIAFIRPFVIRLVEPRGGYGNNHAPTRIAFGTTWFFRYSAILMTVFLILLLGLEIFGFTIFTFLTLLFSFVLSMLLVMLYQFIFSPKV